MGDRAFELYETVRVIARNATGMIIDRTVGFHGEIVYIVEMDSMNESIDSVELVDCLETDIERI